MTEGFFKMAFFGVLFLGRVHFFSGVENVPPFLDFTVKDTILDLFFSAETVLFLGGIF